MSVSLISASACSVYSLFRGLFLFFILLFFFFFFFQAEDGIRDHCVTGVQTCALPIFNRSQYEDVLIARVHNLVPKDVWSRRYKEINDFEKLLAHYNTIVLKF